MFIIYQQGKRSKKRGVNETKRNENKQSINHLAERESNALPVTQAEGKGSVREIPFPLSHHLCTAFSHALMPCSSSFSHQVCNARSCRDSFSSRLTKAALPFSYADR